MIRPDQIQHSPPPNVKTPSSRIRSFTLRLGLGLILMCSAVAHAKDYKVEVLIFENVEAHPAYENQPYTAPEKPRTNAEIWPLQASMLLEQASAISLSEDYELLGYMSWGQESLPLSESAAREISELSINGWIKVYANQLLFANLDLDVNGYRMIEKRRLKLDELHYFDHPKFGLLMQVSRLEETDLEVTDLETYRD